MSESGKKIKTLLLPTLALLLSIGLSAQGIKKLTIGKIFLVPLQGQREELTNRYRPLLEINEGDPIDYQKIRKSLDNLFRTGLFSNIEVKSENRSAELTDLFFYLENKFTVAKIQFRTDLFFKKVNLMNALFSIRKGSLYSEDNIAAALTDLTNYLNSRGFFNPKIETNVTFNEKKLAANVTFNIFCGQMARVRNFSLQISQPELHETAAKLLQPRLYIPETFNSQIEKVKTRLKAERYFFPDIQINEHFTTPGRTELDLDIHIECGYRYTFRFEGMKNRIELISSTWENKVFEKWAEQESKTILLNFLRNRGYLNAIMESNITTVGSEKSITFSADVGKKYSLGNIGFSGNELIRDEQLRPLVSTDNIIFNRLIWLRPRSVAVDLELIKLYYIYQGFPTVRVQVDYRIRNKKADVEFIITEGKRYTVDSVLFSGNLHFNNDSLLALISTKINGPFVQRTILEDIERLTRQYLAAGYENVRINYEISPGFNKSLLVRIDEGKMLKMRDLIIIGASNSQRNLLQRKFPLKKDAPFNSLQLEEFQSEIETSAIFTELRMTQIPREDDKVDILIRAIPDNSSNYGFGLGWEERKGLRGTLEYQEKNILNSTSSLSAILQIGINERRGVLTYDTPFFFGGSINSTLKLWEEDEIYSSYKFNRYGLGGSLLTNFTQKSYFITSLRWYRTKLIELLIPETDIDRLDDPFDTTALSLNFVYENRDDPFNPTRGDFFSSDIKVGLPFIKNNQSYFKVFWSYQKNFKFLKRGLFSFSVKNGFAYGDVSIAERYFAGGPHSFRGTRTDRLGPRDLETNEPSGGKAIVLFNLETTFPMFLLPIDNLYYSFFADLGDVFIRPQDFNLIRMEGAVGLGIKYKTPLGPLRVDFAFNLRKEVENRFLIQLGIGNVF